MVRSEVIGKRLAKLEGYITILGDLQSYTLEQFVSDPLVYGSAERFLHLAVEALIDIGNHVVADENLGQVDRGRDIPRLLAEHGYISEDQASVWTGMIGFRNILVHDYLDVDRQIVYDLLINRLDDFRGLMRVFAGLLD